MNKIDGGVTTPKGYKAAGARAGIKPDRITNDMAMLYSEIPAAVAGTFTKNVVKAAPVVYDMGIVENEKIAQAVVVNTGIANACTGDEGYKNTEKTAKLAGEALDIDEDLVLIGSTGVIGYKLPMDKIEEGVKALAQSLSDSREAGEIAANAILTTDTHKKETAYEFSVGGKTCYMGGMCKGSGMIHPNMGTMLGYITTDCAIGQSLLQKALRIAIEDSFNMISVDGDTSTNDTVLAFANGMAENALITEENEDYNVFLEVLKAVCLDLAKEIAADGEGATRLFTVIVNGADTDENARTLAKSVVTSNLVKCAIYGQDANVGRVLCAMGYSGVEFDPCDVDITVESANGSVKLAENGMYTDFDEEEATNILAPDQITCIIDVKAGDASATAYGCDFTYDYVKINADYRS